MKPYKRFLSPSSCKLPPTTLGLVALLLGCGSEIVLHELDEREANHVIEILADSNIAATKERDASGRTVVYNVAVPQKSRIEATKILNSNELPKRKDTGYTEIFTSSGLIPTASEERAKQLAAIEGEIEKQLRLIDGILDVQVQLVIPEEDALRTTQDARPPTTASVTVKYMPGPNDTKPITEARVAALVAAGVERLTADNVVVILTPAGGVKAVGLQPPEAQIWIPGLAKLSPRSINLLGLGLVATLLVLAILVIFGQIRIQTLRNRLQRLQQEIAKARRKVEGGSPGAPPA